MFLVVFSALVCTINITSSLIIYILELMMREEVQKLLLIGSGIREKGERRRQG